MIPNLTPPTDNLYKFIAIFGLGILVLGILNMSAQQDKFIQHKIEIEEMEKQIIDTIHSCYKLNLIMEEGQNIERNILETDNCSQLNNELNKIKSLTNESKFPANIKIFIFTKIDIIEIKLMSINKQRTIDYFLFGLSLMLMAIGFTLWYLKEQRWRDRKLKIEQ